MLSIFRSIGCYFRQFLLLEKVSATLALSLDVENDVGDPYSADSVKVLEVVRHVFKCACAIEHKRDVLTNVEKSGV